MATTQILYQMPDHPLAAADLCRAELRSVSEIPALQDFFGFWQEDSMLYSAIVAHSRLIKPTEFRAINGLFLLH